MGNKTNADEEELNEKEDQEIVVKTEVVDYEEINYYETIKGKITAEIATLHSHLYDNKVNFV